MKLRLSSLFLMALMFILPWVGEAHLLVKDLKWTNGQEIKILFLNGGQDEKVLFKRAVSLWGPYLHLKFKFFDLPPKKLFLPQEYKKDTIRVRFDREKGLSYSLLGKSYNEKTDGVMNIAIDPKFKLTFVKTVLHELGHGFGLLHEHQHPDLAKTRTEEEIKLLCEHLFLISKDDSTLFQGCINNIKGGTRSELEANGGRLGIMILNQSCPMILELKLLKVFMILVFLLRIKSLWPVSTLLRPP